MTLTNQFIKTLDEVAIQAGFEDPARAYWECANFSQAAKRLANELGIDCMVMVCDVIFEFANGEIKAGDRVRHSFLKVESQFLDYTANQATLDLDFPFKGQQPSRKHLAPLPGTFFGGQDQGSEFWFRKLWQTFDRLSQKD